MSNLFLRFAVSLLMLIVTKSYAQQYNKKQIDSLLDAAKRVINFDQGTKLVNTAYNASKAINYQEGIVNSLLAYASKNNNARRYEDAFKYATQAEKEAAKLDNPSEPESRIALIKGISYNNLGFNEDGRQAMLNGIIIAKNIADPDLRHYRTASIYNALAQFSDDSQAIIYYKQAYSELTRLKKPRHGPGGLQDIEDNLASVLLKSKQYDSTEFYLNKAISLATKEKDTSIMAYTCGNFGDLYYAKKQYALSEKYYKRSIDLGYKIKDAFLLKFVYLGLSKTYTALNDNEKANQWLARYSATSDSLNAVQRASVKTPLNYIVKTKEQQLAANRSRYLGIILMIFFALIVVVGAGLHLYRRFRKKLKLTIEQMNELMAKIELHEDKRSPAKIEELKTVVQLAVNNDPAFITKFNDYDPDFSKKLLAMAKSLIAAEIEFCAMLRLNFETKEIARYARLTVRAVEAKKHRIRKKLGIPSDQDINIWMAHI